MKTTKQARREAKELFRSCFRDGRLDHERVRQAVREVLQAKPRGHLAILSQFQRLVKLSLEQRSALVESPVPLPPDLQSRLQDDLARAYGPGLDVSFARNPALLGGLRIRVGSDVFDGTIRARLTALENSF